ncbi:MAG: bifunctional phosphoribosylaminoimidazolecarboxamide formyltransferase/IMP cyclohydrolase PurH [Proteobacteria bacterium]|nr:bifunctional phosphoribosylaminoimidazolecarboxamide formyltransferase/IMP cyclohydrolase PurH [Pseudomonadota bacterium]
MPQKIKTALLSVSDKSGLKEFAAALVKSGVEILSTGGTAEFLRKAKIKITDVSDHTGFPEIMDGRVKTLHPNIHGGILGRRKDKAHMAAMKKHKIVPIDLVVVNLYPFEETVAKGAKADVCIENIDIGGPSMIRSAAKNHGDVVVVVDPKDYDSVIAEMKANKGGVSLEFSRTLAGKAFSRTAAYDAAISAWFASERGEAFPAQTTLAAAKKMELRYGENPHQKAALYLDGTHTAGVATATQLQGKELSYNNISDADAALELVNEFVAPAVAIIKHANPCGVAVANTLAFAYEKALACDPVSAYGSIIALNKPLDKATAEKIAKLFVEVIIAPDAEPAAREIIAAKKNLRLLVTGTLPDKKRRVMQYKSIAGGLLAQERDYLNVSEKDLKVVTKRKPTKQEIQELLFAFHVCKHVKSNAIVMTQDMATVGIGAGQMSRVDSVQIAGKKANLNKASSNLTVASDAFFPFSDGLILAHEAGATAAIQPGGSIRDEEVIKAADERGMTMVFTGFRHFKH